jgi:hypothetical protein
MKTSVDDIKEFIDVTFPLVELENPNFPVMVVLFSAALLRNASPAFLQEFTGYRREFIDALAANMVNNGLWENDLYPTASWLRGSWIVDEDEFGMQVEAAIGYLWYSEVATNRPTIDVLSIDPNPKPQRTN